MPSTAATRTMTVSGASGPRAVTVGDPVWIFAYGHWFAGFVAKVGTSRLTVEYRTGPGHLHHKAVKPSCQSLVRHRSEGEVKP